MWIGLCGPSRLCGVISVPDSESGGVDAAGVCTAETGGIAERCMWIFPESDPTKERSFKNEVTARTVADVPEKLDARASPPSPPQAAAKTPSPRGKCFHHVASETGIALSPPLILSEKAQLFLTEKRPK